MSKSRFVLWSGGFDSTYLIQKSLLDGYQVTAGYCEIENNDLKTKYELRAIEAIVPKFQAVFGSQFNWIGTVSRMMVYDNIRDRFEGFDQIPVWLMNIMYAMPRYDEIAVGYVRNDDAISFLNEIRAAFDALKPLAMRTAHNVEIVFPLSKLSKTEIKGDFSKEIASLTVSCEHLDSYFSLHVCLR